MSCNDVAIVKQFQAVQCHVFSFGGKTGDEVGADRRVGSRCLDPLDGADRIGAAVPALHPLQDHVVAGLQRQMEVRHQARLAGDQFEQGSSISMLSSDDRRRRCSRGSAASRRWQRRRGRQRSR